jgi:hypothetical protein
MTWGPFLVRNKIPHLLIFDPKVLYDSKSFLIFFICMIVPGAGAVMEGSYDATAQLYGSSDPSKSIGCIILSFSLKQC